MVVAPRLKNFFYFWKWNFLASYFSYISGGNFQAPKMKKPCLKTFLPTKRYYLVGFVYVLGTATEYHINLSLVLNSLYY